MLSEPSYSTCAHFLIHIHSNHFQYEKSLKGGVILKQPPIVLQMCWII